MPILKAGVADSTKFFNLNGVDYPKNGWTLYYSNIQNDSNGAIIEDVIQVGLKHLEEPDLTLEHPALVRDWKNGADVAYTTLNGLLADMASLINLGLPSDVEVVVISDYASFPSSPNDGATVYVSGDGISGTFVYDSSLSATDDGGVVKNGWVRQFDGYVNALWFEVPNDGVTDVISTLTNTLAYCASNSRDLFMPEGTYLFNSESDYFGLYHGIRLSGSSYNFRIFGEQGTKITSSKVGDNDSYMFLLLESTNGLTIEDIEFENTHGITTNATTAIQIIGTDAQDNTIKNCRFSGFYNTIGLNAGQNNVVEDNYFFAPLGHDNASNDSKPAVYVRVISNATGTNRDVIVRNNIAYGYTGTDITTTVGLRSMDGFYFGYADGALIEGNSLFNFCEEAIASQGYEIWDANADIRPTIIRGNYIDSSLPTGTTNTQNFGILFDGSNHVVEGNYIRSGYGIISNGINNNRVAKNNTVRNNKYFGAAGVDSWFPLFIRGYGTGASAPAENYLVENNEFYLRDMTLTADTDFVFLADANYFDIKNNKFIIENVTQAGFDLNIYKFNNNVDFVNYGEESIRGTFDNLTVDVGGNSNLNYISSSGDVVGPASSTDNKIVLYDGTSGKLLKDSNMTQDGGSLVLGAASPVFDINNTSGNGSRFRFLDVSWSSGIAGTAGDLSFRTGGSDAGQEKLNIASSGAITATGTISANSFIPTASAPSSASDTGTQGEIRVDADYIYVCTATNTWKRVAIATW